MGILDELKYIKERYLHAYRSQRECIENKTDPENTQTDFYMRTNDLRIITMNRIRNPLEMIAMDIAWNVQKIKHPLRMRQLNKAIKALE